MPSQSSLTSSSHNKKTVIAVLIFSTLVFAINTFYVIPLFPRIAEEFNKDISLLGLINASLFIGIGLAQIPAGVIAARYTPRVVAIGGMVIIAVSSFLVSSSSDVNQIALFRFFTGAGLASFFASAIVLIAQNFPKERGGLGVGILVGAQAAGGVLGLVGWAILSTTGIMEWRTTVAVASILAVISAILLYLLIPRAPKLLQFSSSSIKIANIRSLLLDKSLIIIGVLLLGSQASLEQTLGFMPIYLQESLNVEPAIAGLVGSITLLAAFAGSPLIGWLYDKTHNLFKLVLIVAGILLVGISINYTNSILAAVASVLMVGFAGGGSFTLLSNSARERVSRGEGKHSLEYTTLSVNWVHCIALTGTFWAPILFSASVLRFSYSTAWTLIGTISFALILIFSLIGRQHES